MNDAATKTAAPATTHLVRLVRLAKLHGAKLPDGLEKGTPTQWLSAVEDLYEKNGGRSGHLFGSPVERIKDALSSLVDALRAEKDAADKRLIPAARERYAATARTLRAEIEAACSELEARVAEQRAAVVVDEAHVVYPALAPVALVREMLAERGLTADFAARVKAADLKTYRAPIARS